MSRKTLTLVLALALLCLGAATAVQMTINGDRHEFTDPGSATVQARVDYDRDSSDNPFLSLDYPQDSIFVELRSDSADTYYFLTNPDADLTGGHFVHPAVGGDDAVTSSGDNVLLCSRVYLPLWLTVGSAYVRNVVASDTGSDETLAVAIYEDADAGTRLATGQSSDATTTENAEIDFTDVTLGPGMYRLCGCAQDVSGSSFHAATQDDETIDVINQDTVVFGTGANSCSSGAPPTTTGALSTADDNIPVIKLAASS